MECLLSTNNLTKTYKTQNAVDKVSLHINKGDIYGFIGRNGAGKTTFMKIISGLAFQTSGEIKLFGEEAKGNSVLFSRVGTLIENPGLYPNLTAYDNLKMKCLCNGINRKGYIEELLKIAGLENAGKKVVKNFSLGMKQRLGVAMALVSEPDLLVLDEPINGLDPQGIAEVREMILKLNKEKNITILISSHILSELSRIATRYGIIHNGSLIEELTEEDLAAKCCEKIEIRLEDTASAITVLDNLGFKNYKVTDKTEICVYERLNESGKIMKALVNADIYVTSVSVNSESLEDYFINLTGGEKNA